MHTELLIIGSGPGGMAAALAAAKLGIDTLVVDESANPGGQVYRKPLPSLEDDPNDASSLDAEGRSLRAQFKAGPDNLRVMQEAAVWGIFEDRRVGLSHEGRSRSIGFDKLIIASGAYDRPVPFPGWTLPGVMTAGGAQRMVKTMGVLPGQNILLAGNGPLQLALAHQILKAGGHLAGVLEVGRMANPLPLVAGLPGNLDLLAELFLYLKTMLKKRVLPKTGWLIKEARGEGRVEEAVIARADPNWRPVPGSERIIKADTVCLGYGLVPSCELTLLAGCQHRYAPELGGRVPVRDERLRTSLPDVFAVGDGAGIFGRKVARLEGELAALNVAMELGRLGRTECAGRAARINMGLGQRARLKNALNRMTTPRPGLFELGSDSTLVCRCEGVTLGEIRNAMASGSTTNDVKRLTRCGMGRCQGRICGPFLEGCLGLEPLSRRPPLKPVPLGVLAESEPEDGGAHAS